MTKIDLLIDHAQPLRPRLLSFEEVGVLGQILVTETFTHALPDLVFELVLRVRA